jgi:hypothetical protein
MATAIIKKLDLLLLFHQCHVELIRVFVITHKYLLDKCVAVQATSYLYKIIGRLFGFSFTLLL